MEPNSGADPTARGSQAADADLALAMAAGDRSALAAVFDRYAPRLCAFCHSMLHSRTDAEDCLQDVFILAATRIASLREADRLRPWLFAIARHECLRRLDRTGREVLVERPPERAPERFDAPADAAFDQELAALLRDAIAGLADRDRLVLDLADRQGLPTDEVAAALSMPVGSAYKLLTRARAAARRSIGALLVARTGRGNCADLATILNGWNGSMTPLLRKRVARHIEACPACQEQERRVASPAALLGAGTAFAMPIPIGLRSQILDIAARPAPAAVPPAPWPDGWPPPSPQLAHRSGLRRNDGPGGRGRLGAPALAIAAAVAAALIVGAFLLFRPAPTPAAVRAPLLGADSTALGSGALLGPLISGTTIGSTGSSSAATSTAVSSPTTQPVGTTRPGGTTRPSATTRPVGTSSGTRPTTTITSTTAAAGATHGNTVRRSTPAGGATAPPATGPAVTAMSIECRSAAGGGAAPVLTWNTARSTGIALSVDNPGIVGSYGRYGPSGSTELPPNGCNPNQGRQTYTVYAIGADGSTAQRTILWDPPSAATTASGSTVPDQSSTPIATPGATAIPTPTATPIPTPSATAIPTPSATPLPTAGAGTTAPPAPTTGAPVGTTP